jgi:desulfoferrodoxin-like iron-binding protein
VARNPGTTYKCEDCGSIVIVAKATLKHDPTAALTCCGKPMKIKNL